MSLPRILTRLSAASQLNGLHSRQLSASSTQSPCRKETSSSNNKQTNQIFTVSRRNYVQTGVRVHSSPVSDPENKGSQQKGVNFDTLGSWNNRLDMRISMKKSIEKGKLIPEIPLDEIGNNSLLGRRKVNEDRIIAKQLTDDIQLFAIFDGHGGATAVNFVQENIEHHILLWLRKTKDMFKVLHNSFIDVNNVLTRHLSYYNLDKNDNTGTTATVCLLRNGIELVVGHVGDTRAILCRNGEAMRLTQDHLPDNIREAERIKASGGFISENSLGVPQVNGRLMMTRSIGDVSLKSFGVIAEPYLRSIEVRHGKDAFLLLTSDGLNFVLSDQELMDIVISCSSPAEAAFFVTDQALQYGSDDNSTAMVIPFGAWGKYRTTERSIPYSFGRDLSSKSYH